MNRSAALLALLGAALSLPVAHADERHFGYVHEADVLPKGAVEFEQWITLRRGKSGKTFSAWDLREEIEYGLLDNLSVAGYLNFRQVNESDSTGTDINTFRFKGISAEVKYQLINPEKHPVGLALYFEPTYNGNEVELEEKVILSKNIGEHWVVAANVSFEQEWEREAGVTKKESVLEFTLGTAYKINSHWSVGIEGRNHRVYENIGFGERLGNAWFVGPNVHYGSARWWATFTILPQVYGRPDSGQNLDLAEHTKVEARLLVGFNF